MGTSYLEVYKRAITEFKDPDIKVLLEEMPILFSQVMYNFLTNAIPLFNTPIQMLKILYKRNEPFGYKNTIIADGVSQEFYVDFDIGELSVSDVVAIAYIDGVMYSIVYDNINKTITIPFVVPENSTINVELYYAGSFDSLLRNDEIYVLSQLVLACWSEYTTNDKLDIIRLLGDTDFKLPSNANTITAKVNWNVVNRETATKRMNQNAWNGMMAGWYR